MARFVDIEVTPQLLAKAQSGEAAAQAEVYRLFSQAVYGLIRRLVPRQAAADDLFQDTFVEVLQSLKKFRGEAPLGAWIRRIAVSKCLMYLRSPWHRSLLWLDQQAGSEQDATLLEPSAPVESQSGDQMDLASALEKLTPAARAVVWLHDVEGYTHQEIAELYGKTTSFSKSQLMRAHLRLRQLLEDTSEERACTPLPTSY